jgi:hypothetical protein
VAVFEPVRFGGRLFRRRDPASLRHHAARRRDSGGGTTARRRPNSRASPRPFTLKQYGTEYTISVNGHTDSRGTDAHNQRLSQGRAESVRSYLVTSGVATGSVKAFGLGETQPVAGNSTPEGRADNRRVEIVVDRTNAEALGG